MMWKRRNNYLEVYNHLDFFSHKGTKGTKVKNKKQGKVLKKYSSLCSLCLCVSISFEEKFVWL